MLAEGEVGEQRPIKRSVGADDLLAEVFDDGVVHGVAGRHQLAPERVCLDNVRAERAKDGGNGGFAAAESAGESCSQHAWSFRVFGRISCLIRLGYTGQMQDVERISEVLETIVCPACRGRLLLKSAPNAACAEELVRCAACGRSYPIEDGIPILLVDRAEMDC
jgi:hypothetical protein